MQVVPLTSAGSGAVLETTDCVSACFVEDSAAEQPLPNVIPLQLECFSSWRAGVEGLTRVAVFCLSGFVQSRSFGLQAEEAEGVFGLRRVRRAGILGRPARHRR